MQSTLQNFITPEDKAFSTEKHSTSFMISKGTVKSKRIMEQKEGEWCPKQKKHLQRPFLEMREEKLY